MRNYALLVRKDFICALAAYGNVIYIFAIWVVMLAFSPSAAPMMFIMLIYLMVIALFTTEENEQVCNVAGILPIRRGQAVTARYLYTYVVLLGGFVAGAVVSVIGLVARGQGIGSTSWLESLILSMAMALLMAAVSMPLIYRFGMTKIRILVIIIYALLIGAASALMSVFTEFLPLTSMALAVVALALTALLSLGSLLVSQRVVQR